MLLRFRFSNFRSFRTEQDLSLIAGPFADHAEVVFRPSSLTEGVLPVAALYGANASGKTNVLRALQFMADAVRYSHTRWQPDAPIERKPFAAEADDRTPSTLTLDFVLEDARYQYGFSVNSQAVLGEWLYAYPNGRKQSWFVRKQGSPILFSSKMPGDNKTIEGLTRRNSLFLSAAAQNNHEALLPVYRWFSSAFSFTFGSRSMWLNRTAELLSNPDYKDAVSQLISIADLGIADLRVLEQVIPEEVRTLISVLDSVAKVGKVDVSFPTGETLNEIQLLHRLSDRIVSFRQDQESDGTIAFLALLGPIVAALKTGGVVCVDELDASLHPLLAAQLIRLLSDSSRNTKAAQLIFNTHDTNLLSAGILRRDQIWFTEKKPDGSSQLYPLTDFKPRREENLQIGYLQGRYGAIPFLNPERFLECFEATNAEA